MKNIFIPNVGPRMHSSTKLMVGNPPRGYEFILPSEPDKKIKSSFLTNSKILRFIYRNIFRKFTNPINIYNKIYSFPIPQDTDLVLSMGRPLNINKPYILEILDHPAAMAGYDYCLFLKNKFNLEKELLEKNCKAIIIVNESSFEFMKKHFGKKVINKCVLVRAAVNQQSFDKDYNKKELQILFIGSLANPEDFYIKGGLEALESFKRISEEFDNVKMIMRCQVPAEIKEKYKAVRNLSIIEQTLPGEEWTDIMKNSDICLNLGHVYPLMATLESLSFGIPIITLDSWGVRDYLTPNFNSILIKPSKNITGYRSEDYPLNIRSKKFIAEINEIDERVINEVCYNLRRLIKNASLREKLSKNALKTISNKFSLERRKNQLKKIFDKAIIN